MPKSTCVKCFRLVPLGQSYCSAHIRKPRPRKKASATRRGLGYEYQKNRATTLKISGVCILCGHTGANSADHIKPRCQGVDNRLMNLAPAHKTCNERRQDKPLTNEQIARLNQYRGLLFLYADMNNIQL